MPAYAQLHDGSAGPSYVLGSLGIGTTVPITSLDLSQTSSALALPSGNSSLRPIGSNLVNGEIRYNPSLPGIEAYVAGAWSPFATGSASQWVNGSGGAIYYTSGPIGIGTTGPISALDISGNYTGGNGPFLTLQQYAGNNAQTFGPALILNNHVSSTHSFIIDEDQTTASNFNIADFNSPYTAYLTIAQSGNVGIGTTNPSSILHIYSNGTPLQIDGPTSQYKYIRYLTTSIARWDIGINNTAESGSNVGSDFYINEFADNGSFLHNALLIQRSTGNIGIETASPSYTLQVNGSVAGTSAYNNTSDARLKKNVQPIAYGVDTVMRLRPISFDWITQDQTWKKKHQLGLIAQEVEPVVPEVVTAADDGMRTRSLAYGELVPVLIKAIQDLKAGNDALQTANDSEAAEINALKARVEALEAEKR